jgi:hypothetical protein
MTEEEWQEHLTRTGTYPVAECASCKETRVLEFFEAFAICASCLAASLRRDVPKPETWRDRPSLL